MYACRLPAARRARHLSREFTLTTPSPAKEGANGILLTLRGRLKVAGGLGCQQRVHPYGHLWQGEGRTLAIEGQASRMAPAKVTATCSLVMVQTNKLGYCKADTDCLLL